MKKYINKKNIIIVILLLLLLTIIYYLNKGLFDYYIITNSPEYKRIEKYILIKPKFDSAGPFRKGLAAVAINSKYGFINKEGKFVITPKYDFAASFSEGVSKVGIAKKRTNFFDEIKYSYGLIDHTGKYILKPEFDFISFFSEGVAYYKKKFRNPKYGLLNNKGEILTKQIFGTNYPFKNGFAVVSYDEIKDENKGKSKFGMIDTNGKLFLPVKYDYIGDFNEGVIPVKEDKKCYYINKLGKIVLKTTFSEIREFHEGLSAFKDTHRKWGYIDKKGKIIISPKYDNAANFDNSIARVELSDSNPENPQVIYVNSKGKEILSTVSKMGNCKKKEEIYACYDPSVYSLICSIYDINYKKQFSIDDCYATNILNNLIFTSKLHTSALIDYKGRVVVESPEFDRSEEVASSDKVIIITRNFKYGLIDSNGRYLIKPIFDKLHVYDNENSMASFIIGSRAGYINLKEL